MIIILYDINSGGWATISQRSTSKVFLVVKPHMGEYCHVEKQPSRVFFGVFWAFLLQCFIQIY